MRGIAQSLSDQDIADVSAYLRGTKPRVRAEVQPHDPPAQVAALIEKGACFSCHGQNFAKPD